MEEEEIVFYGPLGSNFCPSVAPEDVELQSQTSKALFKAIPTLQQIKFEPGTVEQVDVDLFAYKVSETLYVRPEQCL